MSGGGDEGVLYGSGYFRPVTLADATLADNSNQLAALRGGSPASEPESQTHKGRIWSVDASLRAVDTVPSKRLVVGYASKPTKDRVNEVVDVAAFGKTLEIYSQNPVMLYMHDTRRPIGKFTSLNLSPEGLFVTGELAHGTTDADEAWKLIQQGILKSFSIGFRELDHTVDDGEIRHITQLELFEISIVSVPANREALFTMAGGKLLDVQVIEPPADERGVIPYRSYSTQAPGTAWDAGAARKSLRTYATSGGKIDMSRYKQGFAWFSGSGNNLTDYSLPHHVASGNTLATNLRGCRAVVAVLAGARGGVAGMSAADRQGAYNHVARHIKSDFHADVAPFKDLVGLDEKELLMTLEIGVAEAQSTKAVLDEVFDPAALPGDAPAAGPSATDWAELKALVVAQGAEIAALKTQLDGNAKQIADVEAAFTTYLLNQVKDLADEAGVGPGDEEDDDDGGDDVPADDDEADTSASGQAGDSRVPGPTAG